ncbi:putative pentatricopeptide repeat-containing protein At3g25060, mitochondrial [Ananas comosus]|uniref:Pentatricopeptide repeat-containing protein At3g25060, mitochondrial n=1 Tax=Ananas comosus TaxID=4615 RepID=A0A6P5GEX6_ANACO|nr:putative pentatricopeptide repeat-containing protein At3g25060, mitochondrial [Ananas comosus]
MRSLQYRPSSFKQLLFSCGGAQTLARIHALIVISGALAGPHSPGHLIAAYARLGDVAAARAVFRTSSNPTISTWNALIVANSRLGSPADVLRLYRLLAARPGLARPDSSTFTLALRACAHLSDLEAGEEIKNRAADLGYRYDVFVCSSLLNLYAKCGKMDDAVKVFDEMPKRDVVSWTTMITGFVNAGEPLEAIGMYKRMRLEGMEGDGIAMVGLVQASAALGDVRMGCSVHGYMVRREINLDVLVETSLVDMYAKNGFLDTALFIFNRMPYKNVVSWSALISGYAQNGLAGDALSMLIKMQDCGLEPDLVALVSAILACSQMGCLKLGKSIHCFIQRRFEFERISATAVIDMYSKCGSLISARALFDRISSRDLISWNTMIASYGAHGCGKHALSLFREMNKTKINPDQATFASLLSALGHSGFVEEGRYWFDRMVREYRIKPGEKHYACIVDLLARAGHVDKAHELIKSMVIEPGIAVWVALLSGCLNHKRLELGQYIAEKVLNLNPDDLGVYSLVSNVYAAAKNWDKVIEVRKVMKSMGMRKVPGYSLVEVCGQLHAFLMEDKSHPHYEKIAEMLQKLGFEMRKMSYVPKTEFVFHDLEEDVM